MDKKDFVIIANLRQDARKKLTKISRSTGIPVSTIFDKMQAYESTLVDKYTAIMDFSKLGFNTRAHIILKANKDSKDELKAYLAKSMNVNTLCKINNGFDFMMDVVFRNIKDMEEFLENLEEKFSVRTKQVYYTIEDIKRESFFSDLGTIDLVAS